jgi:Glyoxalase/Bleomycin resistance protein/Dioxygenase superfamily
MTTTDDALPWTTGTYPTNRLSHAVFCVAPDDFDACRDYWATGHGVVFDDIPLPDSFGLRVVFSIRNGIEIISPTSDAAPAPIREFLDKHGNGIYAIVYGVPDLTAAVDRAAAYGVEETARNVFTNLPPWSATYKLLEESTMTSYLGMQAMFIQVELH